jgi:hypothetical protein
MLAEGVETENHHEVVCQLGAKFGQGYLYGKPTENPAPAQANPSPNWRRVDAGFEEVLSPFDALGGQTISHASTELLISLGHEIFIRGMHHLDPSVVIALVPDPRLLDHDIMDQLAHRGVVSAALGPGVPPAPAHGVRGSWRHDPALDGEWATVVLGPHCSVAIMARRLAGTDSQFEYGVTHDRHQVISAARCLMRNLGPRPDTN